ncbi:MAG: class I SAM-dependent methyltransferase [Ilumatobacteraceae bacterium]
MLTELPPHRDHRTPAPFAGPDHPMRRLTRAMALGEPWTADDAARVSELFDGLAPDWSVDHVDPVKGAPVLDAIERGGPPLDARWIELGAGTGAGMRLLQGRVRQQVAVDLSEQMLAHAPRDIAPMVRADSSRLPFPDDIADVVLMINMILFPTEVDRILRPDGHVVWVNTMGDQTPIHLPAEDVVAALPGDWSGITSYAGTGTWAVLHRR